ATSPRPLHAALPTCAGRHLARTRRYLPGVGLELEPDDLPAAAVEQARRGDGWVKIVGDWIDRGIGDLAPCWPAATLKATVDAVQDRKSTRLNSSHVK